MISEFQNAGLAFVNFPTLTRGYMISGGSVRTFYATEEPTVVPSSPGTPDQFSIDQNYPNPFNPSTTIHFAIPKSGFVTVKVYATMGREIATLV